MAASISFNGNAITQELELNIQRQLPYIAKNTINSLLFTARKDLQHEMKDSFKNPRKFTLDSVLLTTVKDKTNLVGEIYLKPKVDKGNAPADYLLPQIIGGLVFQTRAQWRLKSQIDGYNGRYMLPLHDSPGTKKDQYGRMKASQYVEALYGIKAFEDIRANMNPGRYRTEGSYIYIRKTNKPSKPRTGPNRISGGPGIYRVMGKNLVQVFKQLDAVPTVQKSFDFAYAAEVSVQKNVVRAFNEAIARLK